MMRPNELPNTDAIVEQIQKLKPGDRPGMVQKYYAGVVDPTTPSGKQLLQRRALLMTTLRTRGLV